MTLKESIGKIGKQVKIAAGLFWADYAALGAQIHDLEQGGADWIHIEVRDGVYMQFGMPRARLPLLFPPARELFVAQDNDADRVGGEHDSQGI